MGKRLYVGNLPYDADEAALRAAFSQDGRVVERVHIVLDRETQRPRGFAFVEMATEEQARQAVRAMDGAVLGARQLRVSEAEERRPGGPGGGPRGPGGPGGPRPGGPPTARGPRPVGAGPGGGPARVGDDDPRVNRFGPDAKPKHMRDVEKKKPERRRVEETDDSYGGRRGSRRFDDDDDE
jgi:RNA recognition motif-containing protein